MRLRLITCSFPGQPQLYTMGIGKLQSAAKLPALLNLCLTVDMMYMEHRVFCRSFYKNSLLMALDGCLMCTEKKMGRFCAINSPVFPQKHTSWHNIMKRVLLRSATYSLSIWESVSCIRLKWTCLSGPSLGDLIT